MYDGTTWSTSMDGGQEEIMSLAVFNGKLYAGQGTGGADGDIFVCNPATAGASTTDCDNAADWTAALSGSQESINALAVFNGRLYAGQGSNAGDGDVLVCNPATAGDANTCDNASDWTTSYNGAEEGIVALAVYNGKLYAGQGFSAAGDGDILVFDGATWTTSFNDTDHEEASELAVFNGKLYAGMGFGASDGDVLTFDGSSWSTSLAGSEESISALAVYNHRLYAGQGFSSAGDGDVLSFDGFNWQTSYAGAQEIIATLAVYNGKLYAGQGTGAGDGDVLVYNERLEAQLEKAYNPGVTTPPNEQAQHFTKSVSLLSTTNSSNASRFKMPAAASCSISIRSTLTSR
jgi:hypothetical protein